MAALKDQIWELMLKNRRTHGEYQFTLPSPDSYPYQWFWDSCFHAIILSHYNTEDAKKELRALVSHQFDNGMIPHIIFWEKNPPNTHYQGAIVEWGKDDTSSITQPPMLAYAAWQIYQKDKDIKFLEEIYPALKKLYNYFLTDRDPRANHLAGIINPDESGEDNSPRFDVCLKLPSKHTFDENFKKRMDLVDKNKECNFDAPFCMRNFFWVKDVPLNVILVENLINLSDIALALEHHKEADLYFIHARLIVEAMRKLMLEDNVFWSTMGTDYKKIKIKTWAILAPLFAHIFSNKEADLVMKDYLKNPNEFGLPYQIPTVSKSEESFDPNGFWRGPVWMATNWFIFKGLKKYGLDEEAQKILDNSLKLLEKSGFREQFNPLTGVGEGAQNFTWGGLVLDMMEG